MSAKLGTLTLDLVARTSSFTQDMKSAGDSVTRETKRMESGANDAISALKNLGAVALAGITVGSIIASADAYVQMAAQIRNATNSTAEYDQVQKHLLQTANTTYRSLQEAQQVYLDVGGALKAYGATTEQALRITDSLSFSFTHNATAADKAATATNAFKKSIYEGKVSGESWRSMLSAIPSIVDDLSRSLDKPKDAILSLGNAGKITTEQLKNSFDQNRELSEELAGNMENSLKDGLTNLSTAWTVFVGEINLSYGVTNKMAAGLGVLASNLDTVAVAGMAAATIYAARLAPAMAITTLSFTAATIESARYQIALARMSAQALATSSSLTILTAATRGVLAFLTGPIGIIAMTAGVAAGYIFMRDNTQKATEKLVEQAKVADKTREELLKLQGVQRASAVEDLTAAFNAQNKELRKSELAMGSRLIAIQNMMKGDAKIADISNKARLGTMSYTQALEELNKLPVPTELYKALQKEAVQYEKNRAEAQKLSDAQSYLGNTAKLVGNEAENAARKQDSLNASMREGELAANGAASAYEDYMNKLKQSAKEAQWIASYAGRNNIPTNEAKAVYDAAIANGGTIGREGVDAVLKYTREANAVRDLDNARAQASRRKLSSNRQDTTAKKEANKAQRDLNQAIEEGRRLLYEYGDLNAKITADAESQINRINKANLSIGDKKSMLKEVEQISSAREQLYLREYESDLDSWSWTIEQKLEKEKDIEKYRIFSIAGMTTLEKKTRAKSFEDQYAHAMKLQDVENRERLLSASEFFSKESEIILKRYELEREQILATYQLNEKVRNQLLEYNKMQQIAQRNAASDKAFQYGADANYAMYQRNDRAQYGQWQGSVAQFDMQNAYSASMSGLKSSYDDQVAGINMLENEEQRNAELLAAHEQYLQAREALDAQYQQTEQDNQIAMHASNLAAYGSAFGAMADMVKGYAGEASGAYQALAIVQKSANLASVIMNGYATISAAWASAPFPANLVNVATATASTGVLQAAMQAFTPNIKGMAHNGIDNIPKEGTWLLDGGERVLNPQQNKDLTNYLSNSSGGGEPVVNIYTLPGQTAEVSRNDRNELIITIKEIINQEVPAQINDPSSRISGSISQGYGIQRNRG